MFELLVIVAIGFLLGMRHATDPDHVIAVTTIVSREGEGRRAALVGAAWGVGHTLTILLVGSAMIVFRVVLPPRLGLAMELAVGVMLIALGFRNLGPLFSWTARRSGPEAQKQGLHNHEHSHPHTHDSVASLDKRFHRSQLYQFVRPLLIGVVHGLAGSAAIALLVLSTISNPRWAVAYLAVFGLGTVLGMMLITVAIGSGFAYGQRRFVNIGRHFAVAAGLISLVFGLVIAYRTGFVDGLFSGTAHWIPR
ncbi:MAG TPA: high-affinity nickel-transport family protein [Terriglobales bacterium]|nr:high-affinity nickel-transport family protein [Terriglobales bacterium]